eukprot:3786573-Pyramimonas_sp.AAC.1
MRQSPSSPSQKQPGDKRVIVGLLSNIKSSDDVSTSTLSSALQRIKALQNEKAHTCPRLSIPNVDLTACINIQPSMSMPLRKQSCTRRIS